MNYKPRTIEDCLWEIKFALGKSTFSLNHLTESYSFINSLPPVPYEQANLETFKWVYEYPAIITFIQMASDYAHLARQLAEHASTLEKGGGLNE